VTLARITWRRRHPPPPALARGRNAVFVLLYACLLVMPVLGWIANSAFGFPPHCWWLVELPSIAAANKPPGFALLAVHVGGALWHHFVWKDGTLGRMMPGPRWG